MSCTSTVKPAFCTWSIQAPQHPQVGVLWTVMRGRAAGVASADWTTTCAEGEVVGCADERSEEHTSELQSLMRISYAVFCLKKKTIMTDSYQTRLHQHNLPRHITN